MNQQVRFGSVGWNRFMVDLDWLIGGFESVDLLIGGWIGRHTNGGSNGSMGGSLG